jgi:hypothetical protein
METIKLKLGTESTRFGQVTDSQTQEMEFVGEKLVDLARPGWGWNGMPSAHFGTTLWLYRTADAKLLVHVLEWEYSGRNTYTCCEPSPADLRDGGRFYDILGVAAGALGMEAATRQMSVEQKMDVLRRPALGQSGG